MKEAVKKFIESFGYSILKKSTLQKIKEKTDPFTVQRDFMVDKGNLCIFDVGAHYGETALIYKEVFSDARIYSFEPFGESVEKFLENTKSYPQIKLFRSAFSNRSGESIFYSNSSDATNSLLNSNRTNSWIDKDTRNNSAITVQTDTIDNFCEHNKIDHIDILKLDVQGAELLVLEGAERMLSSNKIDMIFSEVEFIEIYENQALFHNVTGFLAKYGYKLFGLYEMHCLENGQIAWGDAIYLKNNTH